MPGELRGDPVTSVQATTAGAAEPRDRVAADLADDDSDVF
jgi:hypothetical protein